MRSLSLVEYCSRLRDDRHPDRLAYAEGVGALEPADDLTIHSRGGVNQHLIMEALGRHLLKLADTFAFDWCV